MLMEAPPIDSIGRLQIGCQQAVIPLQALDHRALIVASLHDVLRYVWRDGAPSWLRRGKARVAGIGVLTLRTRSALEILEPIRRPARLAIFAGALFNWHIVASCLARTATGCN